MRYPVSIFVLTIPMLFCGCSGSENDVTKPTPVQKPAIDGPTSNPFVKPQPPAPTKVQNYNDALVKDSPVNPPQPPAQADQVGFDLRDRRNTDIYLKTLIEKWERSSREQNPLARQEMLTSLRGELDDLNAKYKGKVVRWRFKTRLSSNPFAVVVDAPWWNRESVPGFGYCVSSRDYSDNIRGGDIIVFDDKKRFPVPPRLEIGRDISESDFRNLHQGDEFLVEGTIQELRYPSLQTMKFFQLIDVYVCGAKIVSGPLRSEK